MILIIGCGRLGGSLAARLEAGGQMVTVLDQNPRNFDANLPQNFMGRTVIGMEIDNDVLSRANIQKAEAVVAVGRDDNTNMMAADVARKIFNVPHIVVRIDNPILAELYEKDGFEVISPILEGIKAVEGALAKREGV